MITPGLQRSLALLLSQSKMKKEKMKVIFREWNVEQNKDLFQRMEDPNDFWIHFCWLLTVYGDVMKGQIYLFIIINPILLNIHSFKEKPCLQ